MALMPSSNIAIAASVLVVGVSMLGAGTAQPTVSSQHASSSADVPSFTRVLLLEQSAATSANVSIGDLNGDGFLDIILAKGRHWPLANRVLLNDGRGRFSAAHDLDTVADRSYSVTLGDVDRDGDLDVVVGNDAPDPKRVYANDGKGRFRLLSTYGRPEWPTRNARVADLNGDGLLDIIVANRTGDSPGANFICLNLGEGRFGADCIAFASESTTTITPADVNGDGRVDLVVPHREGGQSYVLLNDGKANFTKRIAFGRPDAAIRMTEAVDLDGDGRVDIVGIDERRGPFICFNQAGLTFSTPVPIATAKVVPYALGVGDVNVDGRVDIIVGNVEAPPTVYFNDGSGRHFTPVQFGDSNGAAYGFALGDLDRDGHQDIAVARSDAPNVVYFGEQQNAPTPARASESFRIVEATIPQMQAAMASGQLTSRELVTQYLVRLGLYEDRLNAALAVNARALEEADALDRERREGKVRGPMHGIPVALKDNIHTTHLPTTGGALAFAGYVPPYEATLTRNLRDAGAIIIAKAGLTELANWMAGPPTAMPGNYNAVGGFAYNPYDPRPDPRAATFDGRPALQTGGSSSGVGTAANLWAASVGTDTGGSVISPSNANMLVGIRPTIGRISRYGIIPITADHDTAGPMTRTVADAAIMLGAMEGAAPDPNDAATRTCTPPPNRDYTKFLNASALKGARIGVPRAFYYDSIMLPGEERARGGLNPEQAKVMAEAIQVLRQQGATLVDPADIPSVVDKDRNGNFLLWDYCAGAQQGRGSDDDCTVNFKYGMKRDFDAWLKTLGPTAPVKTLTELRQWNLAHAKAGAARFNQSRLDISDEMDVERDRARFDADHKKDWLLSRDRGIDAVLKTHRLDAILTPGGSGAGLAARAGYPIIVVPFGMVPNAPMPPFPSGFDAKPAPFGVGFTGAQCSEPRLIELAFALEQATKRRVPPASAP